MEGFALLLGILSGLAAAAFFAACEGAFLSLPSAPEEPLSDTGTRSAARPPRLFGRPGRLQHGIALGKLLAVAWIAALAWGVAGWIAGGEPDAWWLAATVLATAWSTFVLGEMAPKAIGAERSEEWARKAGPLLAFWLFITHPLTALLDRLMKAAQRVFGSGSAAGRTSSEAMRSIVADTSDRADIEIEERQMISSIFSFGETTAREVMTPRPDIVAIEARTSWQETVRRVRDAEHSRVPVYEGTMDSIIGVLYAKDLLAIVHGQARPPATLTPLLREAAFVPEAKKIDDLLREFQSDRTHMAVVVDEYGGTAGIVTLEDILEELVGEIQDEYDREEPLFEVLADDVLRIDGRLDFDDFNELTGSRVEAPEVETIGGLVARELGRVAVGGEEIAIDGWVFRVEAVDGKRILKVCARREGPA
ncbi:MAG TPA: hemolysin family protein [Gemmatimonadota bacterium]|nr:hemolysin family protein [Gemmatimonadota bacterium]